MLVYDRSSIRYPFFLHNSRSCHDECATNHIAPEPAASAPEIRFSIEGVFSSSTCEYRAGTLNAQVLKDISGSRIDQLLHLFQVVRPKHAVFLCLYASNVVHIHALSSNDFPFALL
jgi:hypothetical protein